jgi:predicted Zn-dependent protease with MMP-like domain
MNISKKKFEELVHSIAAQVVDSLPPDLRADAVKVILEVADKPSPDQLDEDDEGDDLLGLYEGVPLVERHPDDVILEPDRVTLFRIALTEMCENEEELRQEIRATIIHELGHYFGFDEDDLEKRGWG